MKQDHPRTRMSVRSRDQVGARVLWSH